MCVCFFPMTFVQNHEITIPENVVNACTSVYKHIIHIYTQCDCDTLSYLPVLSEAIALPLKNHSSVGWGTPWA